MYKLSKIYYGEIQPTSVFRLADGAAIPFDPDNTDYQQYLKWVAEGNEPLPFDEGDA